MERASSIKVKMLVEGAMMIAIASILSMIKVFEMPYGGSVTAASMVPIMIYAYRWGGAQGILAGCVYGILQFVLGPYAAHPLSIVLDYPVAFGCLGLTGYIAHKTEDIKLMLLGIALAVSGRFLAHFISGFVFFYMYAPESMSPVIYSLVYNANYLVPEMVISMTVFSLLRGKLKQLL